MGLLGKLFRDHGKKDKGTSVVAVMDAGVVVVEAEHKVKEKSVFTKLSSRPMSFVGKRDSIVSAKPTAEQQARRADRVQDDRSPYGNECNEGNRRNASSAPVSRQSISKFMIGEGDVASSSSSTVDSISSVSGESTTADTSPSTSNPSIPLKTTGQSSGSLASMRRNSPLSTVVDSNSLPTPPPSPLPTLHSQDKSQRRNSIVNIFLLKKAKSHSSLSLSKPAPLPSPPISSNSSSTSLRSTSSRNTANTGATSTTSGRSRNSLRVPMSLNHPDLAFVPSVEDFTHSSILAGDPLGANYYLYPKPGRVPPPPMRRTAPPPPPPPPFPSHPSHYNKQQRFMEPTILEETGGTNSPPQRRQNGPRPQDPRRRSMPVPPQHYNNLNMYLAPPQQTRRRSMYNSYDSGGMPIPRNNNWRRPPPVNAGEPRNSFDGMRIGRDQQAVQSRQYQTEKQKEGAEASSVPTVTIQAAA